jgi:hypothetical protein
MKRGSYGPFVLGFTVAVTRLGSGDDAAAHGGVDEERSPPEQLPAGARSSAVEERHESTEGTEREREDRFAVRLDLVLGWGKVPFAVQNLPTTGAQQITYSRSDATPSDVQSFILGGQIEATEHIGAGVRLPFMVGTFSPVGSAARSTTSVGNVEVEGEVSTTLGAGLKLVGALGVALPTGQGEEIPTTLVDVAAPAVNAPAYDRFSLARAAALARGYEANALFETGRLGLIPQVSLVYEGERLRFEPYLKVENLIRTDSSLEAPYVGEIVAAVRGGYLIHRHVELALRGWVNVGFAGTPEDRRTTVAIEPDLTASFGPVRAYGGCVVPLAGAPEEAGFFGVRLGLVISF